MDPNTIDIYAKGILATSVCAHPDMSKETIEKMVNKSHPTGIDSGWAVSEEEFFGDGKTPNGGIVNCRNGETRHWLLIC